MDNGWIDAKKKPRRNRLVLAWNGYNYLLASIDGDGEWLDFSSQHTTIVKYVKGKVLLWKELPDVPLEAQLWKTD